MKLTWPQRRNHQVLLKIYRITPEDQERGAFKSMVTELGISKSLELNEKEQRSKLVDLLQSGNLVNQNFELCKTYNAFKPPQYQQSV